MVRDIYKPQYHHTKSLGENYTFRLPATDDLTYEFLGAAGWSEGLVMSSPEEFKEYVIKTALEYNNPPVIENMIVERSKK